MTDSETFTTPEADEEETGEDLGGLDDLLASLRSDEEAKPKRGRGRAKKEAPAKDFKAVLGQLPTNFVPRWMRRNTSTWFWV